MVDPETIYNWRRLDDRITTSGQPTEQQLADIRALGVQHIVNLGLHTHEKALPDEAASVASLGMTYIHIPVNFQNPTDQGLQSVLRRHGTAKGCPCSRALHRERSGLCLLLPLSPRRAGHGRDTGTCRDRSGLATKCHLGGICGTAKREAR